MKIQKRVVSALVSSLFLAAAAPATQAQQFSNVIVFGDSLSDAGFFRPVLTAAGVPAALVPILGRFTTSPGPIWAEIIAQHYGVTLLPSNVAGGTDFAQGGARVATNSASTPTGAAQRPLTTQVTEYLARGPADPNALYTIWAGANDVIQILGGASSGAIPADQVPGLVQGAAVAEIGQIARLRAAGARYIMVFGLPNIGATPGLTAAGATASATATQLSAGFNTALFAGLAGQGIRAIPIDSFSFLSEIRANPAAFGFTNITTPACRAFPPFSSGPDSFFCPPNAFTAGTQDTFLFADGIHPTSAGHRLIAQFAEAVITGPTQYSLLAEAPLSMRAGQMRTLTEGMATTRQEEIGRWSVFVGGDKSDYDIDPSIGFPAMKARNRSITVGAAARISEAATMGIAYSHARTNGTFNGNFGSVPENPGGFNADEDVISIFGSAGLWRGLYGTAVVSIGDIHFNDVRRNVYLGPSVRTSNTKVSGSNASAQVTLGYDFAFGPLVVGPTVGVTAQSVEVDGFDEIGMASANLRMGKQRRKSEIWSAGVRLSGRLGPWTPWVKVTADTERRDDLRLVSAAPISILDGSVPFDVPAYTPDTTFTTASAGVHGNFTDRIGVSVSYYRVSGRSGSQDDGLAALLSVRF